MRVCSSCKVNKPLSNFDKNGAWLYSKCKQCKATAAVLRKYGEDGVALLNIDRCQCCGEIFKWSRNAHIHHVGDKVKGRMCQKCNHILAQETVSDTNRVRKCLEFMESKNPLDRVNPQGSSTEPLNDCTLGTSKKCKRCKQTLSIDKFSKNHNLESYRNVCKRCVCLKQAERTYGVSVQLIETLRKVSTCQCCGEEFTATNPQHIHHLKVGIRGVVCLRCNHCLADESIDRKHKLQCCLRWLEVDDTV